MLASVPLTGNIRIRPLQEDDTAGILAAYTKNKRHLEPWEPTRTASFFTMAGQASSIETQLTQTALGTSFPLVITDGDAVIGRFTLNGITHGPFQSASLGYWLDEDYTGQGLATLAVDHVCSEARDLLHLHRIEAGTLLHNTASQRVLQKAGFERIGQAPNYLKIAGRWQDHALFQRILHD